MGYWGWRPLIIALFISVWVVGCSITSYSPLTPTPTLYPQVTLTVLLRASPTASSSPTTPPTPTPQLRQTPYITPTPLVYTVQPGDTLLNIALNFGIDMQTLQAANGNIQPLDLQSGQQLLIPNPRNDVQGRPILITATPVPLQVGWPVCYEAFNNRILCLGHVDNRLDFPVERVIITVRLLRRDGSVLAEQDVGIEQSLIPPGVSAPYRALFEANWDDFSSAVLVLRSADTLPSDDLHFITLNVESEESHLVRGHYIVSATVYNPSPQPAVDLRAVLTLYDADGQVAGYRVLRSSVVLNAGERLPIQLDVIPYHRDVMSHTLYVEARAGNGKE